MKNKLQPTLIIAGVIIIIAFFGYMYTVQSTPAEEKVEVIAEETKESAETSESVDEEDEQAAPITKDDIEDAEKVFPFDMSESAVQDAIHKMSHQKVKADKKWGALQITPARIDRLIEVIQANDYKHESTYLHILNNWKDGDFSRAHHDHNSIWELQGGTVGKATGVLSAEEEARYVQRNFE
ncbi:DUF6241 domain-containing protein [Bacillus sp. PS06]|uniref:DUF6241 domain-containing protein n=1 Tax=Bacillus sp. PS06 TaxID=2764176 RepID=UPI00178062E2|nr:DUF6241 domain-containing protein [Bacillus sp. PS06]MBD8069876.1 hypothetical protein [Bacillus sp. PS06]